MGKTMMEGGGLRPTSSSFQLGTPNYGSPILASRNTGLDPIWRNDGGEVTGSDDFPRVSPNLVGKLQNRGVPRVLVD